MNELYKDKLGTIADDELLISALRELFGEAADRQRPRLEDLADNTLLGEKYRAYKQSKDIINQAFVDLSSYKVNALKNKTFNKER
jgi:hypothetical protein